MLNDRSTAAERFRQQQISLFFVVFHTLARRGRPTKCGRCIELWKWEKKKHEVAPQYSAAYRMTFACEECTSNETYNVQAVLTAIHQIFLFRDCSVWNGWEMSKTNMYSKSQGFREYIEAEITNSHFFRGMKTFRHLFQVIRTLVPHRNSKNTIFFTAFFQRSEWVSHAKWTIEKCAFLLRHSSRARANRDIQKRTNFYIPEWHR